MLSMVVPTHNEVKNIPILIERILKTYEENNITGEIIVVAGHTEDDTKIAIKKMAKNHDIKLVVLRKDRGFTSATIRGIKEANYDIVGVIDPRHPLSPEAIPKMLKPILNGKVDLTLASRYVSGGGQKERSLKRGVATRSVALIAMPLTKISDPMSWNMMVRKDKLKGVDLDTTEQSLASEIIVKCKIRKYKEVPLVFNESMKDMSEPNMKQQLNYLAHLKRLYHFKYKSRYEFFMFCFVGGLGTFVDMGVFAFFYYLLLFRSIDLGWYFKGYILAQAISFTVAATHNFILNKYLTFNSKGKVGSRYIKFFIVAAIALAIRSVFMAFFVDKVGIHPLISLVIVIIIVMFVNFTGSKLWAFKK